MFLTYIHIYIYIYIYMPDGTERKFLQDGDSVIMKAFCKKDGKRVGFGEVRSKILPCKKMGD